MGKGRYFFLQIKSTESEVAFSDTRPECWEMSGLFPLPLSSEVFGCLRESSDMFMLSSKSQHSQDKNLMPITQKKLAGTMYMYQL